jgi:hypothetical protein
MEKISQAFASTISNVQKRLQSFLENDFDPKADEKKAAQETFEASRDLSLIRGLSQGLPEDHIDRAIVVFSRMALHFDAGILLENQDGVWKAQASFNRGITELLKNPAKLSMSLPAVNMLTVLKTDSKPMLQKLQLQALDPFNRTECLLIKATPDFAFLLFSTLPDIWLKDHIEHVRTALVNGFAD